MRKKLISVIAAVTMFASVIGGLNAAAFEEWSYSEDLTVYVNGEKIDNGEYKPIIVNDRTLVRLVPVFEALGYQYGEMQEDKSISFFNENTGEIYSFVAESNEARMGFEMEEVYYLDVPATLQYFDVFYVPIRSFCEMTGLSIDWDALSRSVYVSSNSQTNITSGNNSVINEPGNISVTAGVGDGERKGYEYCFMGMVVGKAAPQEYKEGTLSMEEIREHSKNYPISFRTDNGLDPQKALDIISAAYGESVSGNVAVYSNCIKATKGYDTYTDNGFNYFKVVYCPDGSSWASEKNVPCYEIYACADENFSDKNTSGKVLDLNYNVIGLGN